MEETSFTKVANLIKRVFVYQPPAVPSRFVLGEDGDDGRTEVPKPGGVDAGRRELDALLRYGERLAATADKVRAALAAGEWAERGETLKAEVAALEEQRAALGLPLAAYDAVTDNMADRPVSTSLAENREIIAALYRLPANKDIVTREITVACDPPLRATLVFMDGMADSKLITLAILQPLMLLTGGRRPAEGAAAADWLIAECLPGNQVKKAADFREVQASINSGDTAIFLDGAAVAILVGTKGWEHRSVGRPLTEQSIRGSQVAFTEHLRTNTGLVRSMLRSSDLVTEMFLLGKRSRINCALLYVESVASPKLVAEVRRRLEGISTDYIDDAGTLEQFIEDRYILPLPQALSTERPDRVAAHLSEGRVAIIVEGAPFAMVLPATFFTFFHSAEDFSFKPMTANFLRILRIAGAFTSVIFPAFYVALTYFHQEALPTELLLAIAGARETVPFPAIIEIAMMEVAFELIREAGVRIPGVLGSTIGIVGAIILGQAAVAARIVSPIIVIIVAITGLASSVIPEYRMAFVARLSRFALLVLSAAMGLVGLASGLLTVFVAMAAMKSFGVPYLAPVAPKTNTTLDVVLRGAVERREKRPDPLNAKDPARQPAVSRQWAEELPAGEEEK